MPETVDKTSSRIESVSLAEPRPSRLIPCVLVYPDQKHVGYVHHITNYIEEVLSNLGFAVTKLCDVTPPDEHFGENFEKLVDQCILGVVVLDGFRPNVLFEYGYLRGKNKIILPVQHCTACIAIKSLYPVVDPSNENEIKSNTGLTKAQFNRLREPSIDHFRQLSDRHGINVVEVDCYAESTSPRHPKNKIKTEVKKLMPRILALCTEQSLEAAEGIPHEYLGKFQNVILRVLQYYTNTTSYEFTNVEKALEEINHLEKDSGICMPSTVYDILSSLYANLARQTITSNAKRAVDFFEKAINLCKRILEIETNTSLRASALNNLGIAYSDLSDVRDKEANVKKAIKVFKEALIIRTKEAFPTNYAMALNNLGIAYSDLSEVRDKEANVKKAIKAYKEALIIRTKEAFPIDYAMAQNNLGVAYRVLSDVRDKEANVKKAIKAYKEALTVYTKKAFPEKHATTQRNLETLRSSLTDEQAQ